jgi:hypothetical protein
VVSPRTNYNQQSVDGTVTSASRLLRDKRSHRGSATAALDTQKAIPTASAACSEVEATSDEHVACILGAAALAEVSVLKVGIYTAVVNAISDIERVEAEF